MSKFPPQRFRRLAADELWWRDTPYYVTLTPHLEDQIERLNDLNYCVKRFSPLGYGSGVRLSPDYITRVVERCPDMREFRLVNVKLGSWPQFAMPWSSLATLWSDRVEVEREDGFSCLGGRGSLPNLRSFAMVSCHISELSKKSIILPNLGSCQRLVSVIVSDGEFVITSQSISFAFPPSLPRQL